MEQYLTKMEVTLFKLVLRISRMEQNLPKMEVTLFRLVLRIPRMEQYLTVTEVSLCPSETPGLNLLR